MEAIDYAEREYIVFKKITVEFSANVKEHNKKGLFFYILKCPVTDFRFGYVSGYNYPNNARIKGISLFFQKSIVDELCDVYYYKNTYKQFHTTHNKKIKKNGNKSVIQFYPQDIFFKKKEKNGEEYHENTYSIHTKKIVVDRELWFIEELEQKKLTSIKKKVIKEILEDTTIDERIFRVLISQFFQLQYAMDYQSHAIILSQGSTGKSSVLRPLSRGLENSSNAGIFGYFDVTKASWVSGLVSQTKKPILVDEINELINEDAQIFKTINTPLENGIYTYGKAGGMTINFFNQFLFVGNVTEDFNFNTFISGVAQNTATIGRRFAYIVYDRHLHFSKGTYRRIEESTQNIELLTAYCTYVLEHFLYDRKFHEKKLNDTKINKLEEEFKQRMRKKIESLDESNELVKKFFKSFIESSLDARCKILALKSAIFKHIDTILQIKDLKNSNLSFIYEEYPIQYKQILIELEHSINNIFDDVNYYCSVNDYTTQSIKDKFNTYDKKTQRLFREISNVHDRTQQKLINYEEFEYKKPFKNIAYNFKTGRRTTKQLNKTLSELGINCNVKNNQLIFLITNLNLFKKYENAINQDLEKENLEIDMTTIDKKTKPKSDIEDIDMEEDLI